MYYNIFFFIFVVWVSITLILSVAVIFTETGARDKADDVWLYLVIQTAMFIRTAILAVNFFIPKDRKRFFSPNYSPRDLGWFLDVNLSNITTCIWGIIMFFAMDADTSQYYKDNFYILWLFMKYYIACMFCYIVLFVASITYFRHKTRVDHDGFNNSDVFATNSIINNV